MATDANPSENPATGNIEQPVKAITDVLKEIREARAKVIAARGAGVVLTDDWSDIDANEGFVSTIFEEHPELSNGYPILLRDVVQNQDFSMRAVKKYFRWVSNPKNLEKVAAIYAAKKPDDKPAGRVLKKASGDDAKKENTFLRTQAEYCYFDARNMGKTAGGARKAASDAYDALIAEDEKLKSVVDANVEKYHEQTRSAKSLIIERLRRKTEASLHSAE